MTRVGWIRLAVVGAAVGLLETACRTGAIDSYSMIPPTEMAVAAWDLLSGGRMTEEILFTLRNVVTAFLLSVATGFALGAVLHRLPRTRRALEPLLASYYAVPIFIFYPLLIVVFGMGAWPLIAIGFLFAVVAVIVNTLNGLDRVPRVMFKVARVHRMSRVAETLLVILPAAAPHLLTGVKLAVAYSFIGVIAGEFILSGDGLGYEIAFAYNNFDNRTMYGLMLFVLVLVASVNMTLHAWERRLHARRGGR
jgi:NitT/TauT family transport system permease protein